MCASWEIQWRCLSKRVCSFDGRQRAHRKGESGVSGVEHRTFFTMSTTDWTIAMALKMVGVVVIKGKCASSYHPSRCHRAYVAFCLGFLLERAVAALRTRWNQLVWNSSSGEDTCQTRCLSGEDARRSRQAARLLLLFCALARANCVFRTVRIAEDLAFAGALEQSIWQCFWQRKLAMMPVTTEARTRCSATVPLCIGGLGIRSAEQSYPAAHRSIWADGIEMDQQRHSSVAASV